MIDQETLLNAVLRNVTDALAEDVGSGDVSGELISAGQNAIAQVITRDAGIFCGLPWVAQTIEQVDAEVVLHALVSDGEAVQPNQPLLRMTGDAASLLTAERTMLNFVQLLSGVATRTAHYCALVADTNVVLLDTRKTIPGLRIAQKYAVTCGGGENHRIGLFDAYLLKENHISAAGSITNAVRSAQQANPGMPVEVEVETLAQLNEAIDADADIVMLDNFNLTDTRTAVLRAAGKLKLEASGGIDENSITEIASTGVDYISIGELTKRIDPMDLSMRFI